MRTKHAITNDTLSLEKVEELIKNKSTLILSKAASQKIVECRVFLDQKIQNSKDPIYGINTGFGSLCDTEISKNDLEKLQRNLVTSHACGMGDEVLEDIVRIMLLLKVHALSLGYSGVQLKTVQRLVDFFNEGVHPVIYELGSLGASGDLAPLAHLALPLIGEGEVNFKGKRMSGAEINAHFGWEPIDLRSKEGLALLNGTQFMGAYSCSLLIRLKHLTSWADTTASASIDAFDGGLSPFDHLVHDVRPHNGQKETAKQILENLNGSKISQRKKNYVQDPYCFRCIPQVHGASKDAIAYARGIVETEINSVTDNPTIFIEADKVISAGNFHGQPLALVLDFLAIAVAELASISERRVYKLVSGQRGLPAFLVNKPGLNSGFMIAQYAAASAVSQNKQLATPASVDTIDSSNGQEDHVSMGANAATKLKRVVDNFERVLAIEWLSCCQALDFRVEKSSLKIEKLRKAFRKQVPFVEEDVTLYPLIEKSRKFVSGEQEI